MSADRYRVVAEGNLRPHGAWASELPDVARGLDRRDHAWLQPGEMVRVNPGTTETGSAAPLEPVCSR
jgi:hypothetical protein